VLELFTGEARQVVVQAHEEAIALGWSHIGSGHLLLGFFGDPQTVAARALTKVGLDRDRVHAQLLANVTPGEDRTQRQMPFTLVASEVLKAAKQQSEQRKGGVIAPEHLLLGMTSLGDGLAVRLLNELGVFEQHLEAAIGVLLRAQRSSGHAA
jgi:ATP-dependent Clp protease ATP-binding subunit ClpA